MRPNRNRRRRSVWLSPEEAERVREVQRDLRERVQQLERELDKSEHSRQAMAQQSRHLSDLVAKMITWQARPETPGNYLAVSEGGIMRTLWDVTQDDIDNWDKPGCAMGPNVSTQDSPSSFDVWRAVLWIDPPSERPLGKLRLPG